MAKTSGPSGKDLETAGRLAAFGIACYGVYNVIKRKELFSWHGLMAVGGLVLSIPWKKK